MTQEAQGGSSATPHTFAEGYLFGAPIHGLGWFASLLMSLAAGFAAFFASTFLAIFALLFYNSFARHAIDFNVTYRDVGLPVGLVVMAFAFIYMGRLWVKDLTRKKS
ncbi:hypothetical protein GCM10011507_23320 [Edaphobacter acidisoli]|uniref:Uncharacterized protein n=1 Tax=Edaphobacter acidisoli TaxID=2040573 RepID=A0A916RUH5_9BACT|nr:hypothetical protein [Edaphobacter acidisoli]GGA71057.1 hypothetical protein GCM10011507_23320 [Edaphobacter acidisoli]